MKWSAPLALCLAMVAMGEIEPIEPPDGLLPDLGDIPDPVAPVDPWAEMDEPAVDPALFVRPTFRLPPARDLLPPSAFYQRPRTYRAARVEGNRIYSDRDLLEVAGWDRSVLVDLELRESMARAITKHYVGEGFINSGAVIPEPPAGADELVIEVTEGRLTEVVLERGGAAGDLPYPADDCITCIITGQRGLRDRFLTSRVMGPRNRAMNFIELQQRLQVLQMNPNIKRLQAELKPGLLPGEATVELLVEETPGWSFGMDFHNHLPPSVGSEQLDLWVETKNLSGFGDHLALGYGAIAGGIDEAAWAGLDNLRFRYAIPVRWDDTTLEFTADRQGYAIIDEAFSDLDITGSTWSAGFGVRRPLLRDLSDEIWWGISLVRKHSETELLGMPFSLSPGYVDGELDLTLLRTGLEWTRRAPDQVFAWSGELVAGLDAMGATDSQDDVDPEFMLVRTRAQYLKKLNEDGHLFAARFSGQWADDRLPSPEQWTLGGNATVRGYPQNARVRDAGLALGLEYRIPVWSAERYDVSWIGFLDGGLAMDSDGGNIERLASVGFGFSASNREWLRAEIYLGFPLTESDSGGGSLQDQGIHFKITGGRF